MIARQTSDKIDDMIEILENTQTTKAEERRNRKDNDICKNYSSKMRGI